MQRKTTEYGRLKLSGDAGAFSAVFVTLNVIDRDGDMVVPGAITNGEAVRIAAWGHAWGDLPVGKGVIYANDREAWVDGQFFLSTEQGRNTYETVKGLGELQEWSFGFDILDSTPGTFKGERVRFLKRLKVHEVSPVLLGAGVRTRTTAIKGTTMPAEMDPIDARLEIALIAGDLLISEHGRKHGQAAMREVRRAQAEILDLEIAALEQRIAGRSEGTKATNLEVLRDRVAAIDGGGHSEAWVRLYMQAEIDQLISRTQAKQHLASRADAARLVVAWLRSPAVMA